MPINLDHLQTVPGIEISEAQRAILAHDEATRGQLSDGYHSFDELYEHRLFLFISLLDMMTFTNSMCQVSEEVLGRTGVWKSRKHSDGSEWEGWFIAGIGTVAGHMVTYHLPNRLWEHCAAPERELAPEFDGHTPNDVLQRLAEKFFQNTEQA